MASGLNPLTVWQVNKSAEPHPSFKCHIQSHPDEQFGCCSQPELAPSDVSRTMSFTAAAESVVPGPARAEWRDAQGERRGGRVVQVGLGPGEGRSAVRASRGAALGRPEEE